jgi:dUTP pyrophosphatase
MLDERARAPYRKRRTDAGYDIYSVENVTLKPQTATIIHTGIIIAAPPGFYYTIEGRSSLWQLGIFPTRGIIDSTYCGEAIVCLVNHSEEPYEIESGDRIAQMILHRQYDARFVLVDEFSEHYDQRGTDGFGSTGR